MFHYVRESLHPKNSWLSDLVKMTASRSDTHSRGGLSVPLGSDGGCFLPQGPPPPPLHPSLPLLSWCSCTRSSRTSPVPRMAVSWSEMGRTFPLHSLSASRAVVGIHGSCSQFIGVRPAFSKDKWNAIALTGIQQRGISLSSPESTREYEEDGKHRVSQSLPSVSDVASKTYF